MPRVNRSMNKDNLVNIRMFASILHISCCYSPSHHVVTKFRSISISAPLLHEFNGKSVAIWMSFLVGCLVPSKFCTCLVDPLPVSIRCSIFGCPDHLHEGRVLMIQAL